MAKLKHSLRSYFKTPIFSLEKNFICFSGNIYRKIAIFNMISFVIQSKKIPSTQGHIILNSLDCPKKNDNKSICAIPSATHSQICSSKKNTTVQSRSSWAKKSGHSGILLKRRTKASVHHFLPLPDTFDTTIHQRLWLTEMNHVIFFHTLNSFPKTKEIFCNFYKRKF